jgi:hypothetical protein
MLDLNKDTATKVGGAILGAAHPVAVVIVVAWVQFAIYGFHKFVFLVPLKHLARLGGNCRSNVVLTSPGEYSGRTTSSQVRKLTPLFLWALTFAMGEYICLVSLFSDT